MIFLYVFLVFLLQFLSNVPLTLDLGSYCIPPYFVTYDFGFVSRGLIGSVLQFIFPQLSYLNLYCVLVTVYFLLIMISSFYCGNLLKDSQIKKNYAYAYLIILFIVNPGSISYLFHAENFGRLDLFWVFVAIISSYLIIKNRFLYLIPLLCTLAVLIHQKFIFAFFPLILLILGYRVYINKEIKTKLIFVLTLIIPSAFFIYLQFFSKTIINNLGEMVQIIQTRTDYPIDKNQGMLYYEYFSSLNEKLIELATKNLSDRILHNILALLLVSPLIFIFVYIWNKASKYENKRFLWLFPLFIIVCSLPQFLLTIDNGRDLAAMTISMFILIFTLFELKDSSIRYSIKELGVFLNNHKLEALLILVWLCFVDRFGALAIINNSFFR